jgi:hypothetical protein
MAGNSSPAIQLFLERIVVMDFWLDEDLFFSPVCRSNVLFLGRYRSHSREKENEKVQS